MSLRVLVVGGSGMLGTDLRTELELRGHTIVAPSSSEFNITDPVSVANIESFGTFDWCVNCAAFTKVDLAETDVRAATELNQLGPGYLARASSLAGIKLIHVSTDFVFDGSGGRPYEEDDKPNPIGVYGRTKLGGEFAVMNGSPNSLVVRTAWLYGKSGPCFPKTMIRVHDLEKPLKVVSDQIGCPTSTVDLARVLVDLMENNAFPGIYHAVGPQAMSWFEFAQLTLELHRQKTFPGFDLNLEPILTEAYPTPAARPKYSVLSTEKITKFGIKAMRPVTESLVEFLN